MVVELVALVFVCLLDLPNAPREYLQDGPKKRKALRVGGL